MKLLVLALSVTLLFAAGEALNCHRCVPNFAGGDCKLTVQTCPPEKDSCGAVKFRMEPFGQYQKCMRLADCEMLKMNSQIHINCCTEDMCNAF